MPGQGRGGLNEAIRLFIKQEEKKRNPSVRKSCEQVQTIITSHPNLKKRKKRRKKPLCFR